MAWQAPTRAVPDREASLVQFTDDARQWIDSGKFKSTSSDKIAKAVLEMKKEAIDMLLQAMQSDVQKDSTILRSILVAAANYDPFHGLPKEALRMNVEVFIRETYPYWDKIDLRHPSKSIDMMVGQVKEKLGHAETLDSITERCVPKLTSSQLAQMCTHCQKLIANCLFYVHVKRCPCTDIAGHTVYRKKDFVSDVDLTRWLRIYGMII